MPKPNIELMKRLRTRFLRMRHKKHFNMDAVAAQTECGSAMCIAGHTLDLAGYKMRLRPGADRGGHVYTGRTDYDFISPQGRRAADPLIAAAKELGLQQTWESPSGAWDLFHDFSLKTPKQAAKRIEKLIEHFESRSRSKLRRAAQ